MLEAMNLQRIIVILLLMGTIGRLVERVIKRKNIPVGMTTVDVMYQKNMNKRM